MRSILRKIKQIPKLSSAELLAYAMSQLNKIHDKKHRHRLALFKENETVIGDILAGLTTDSQGLDRAESEFRVLVDRATTYFQMPSTADVTLCNLIYKAVRLIQPDNILETGVWRGLSSYFLLSALEKNGGGALTSVDMPPMDPTRRVVVGEAVPDHLRQRWSLLVGPASNLLPEACGRHAPIDLFVHDSEHSYRNMMFEFRTVWKHLRLGASMIVDDADWNDSVPDFCDEMGVDFASLRRDKGGYIAIIRKPSE